MMQKIKVHFQRFEFKYQLPANQVEGLIPEFLKYMDFDPYSLTLPEKAYTVTSLYYDSIGFGCYYDKIAGLRNRKKLRIRTYSQNISDEMEVFLEIKRKYDAVVVKDRLRMNFLQSRQLLEENKVPDIVFDDHDKQTLEEFLWLKYRNSMIPQNVVTYKRRPFISKVDKDFRVTIDYDIKTYLATGLDDVSEPKPVNPGVAVLELKFNNILPFWFHRIIQQYNLQQRPFSKYCNALEVCRPELIGEDFSTASQRQIGLIYNE